MRAAPYKVGASTSVYQAEMGEQNKSKLSRDSYHHQIKSTVRQCVGKAGKARQRANK